MAEDRARLTGNHKDGLRAPGRILYSSTEIAAAVLAIAGKITDRTGGEALSLLILLKGGVRFGCDLIRALPGEFYHDFAGVSSYGEEQSSSGKVEFYHFQPGRELIDNRVVVLVDDICDSGATFSAVTERLRRDYKPSSLLSCALIWREGAGFTPDFHGFHYGGDQFLVGYGLGAGERYRELDGVYILDQ